MPSLSFALWAGALFFVPLLRLALWPIRVLRPVHHALQPLRCDAIEWLGRAELYLNLPRDVLCAAAGLLLVLGALVGQVAGGYGLLLLVYVAISQLGRRFATHRAIQQLLRHPDAHPDDFFRAFWRACSPWPPAGQVATRAVAPDGVDFTHRRRVRFPLLALGHATFDTLNIAFLLIQAARTLPQAELVRLVDGATRLWSTRCAWHHRLRLEVMGLEALAQVRHQALVVFNHESLMDFALGFYATGGLPTARGRRIRVRFIAAKDHFFDNVFIHSVLGVGRAMVSAGMIFVDRKTRGAAGAVIADSVEALRQRDVDLGIFPQGTRAGGHFGADGEVIGAGYYTTARRLPGRGHFRRGAAAIAAGLSRHQAVDVLCVGIVGTARVVPARRLQVRTHVTVRYHIVAPITIGQGEAVDEGDLLRRMDQQLRLAAGVDARLVDRWQRLTGADDSERAEVERCVAAWGESGAEEAVPLAVLDAILTFDPEERPAWLARFTELAVAPTTAAAAWDSLRAEVATALQYTKRGTP